jgi:hypothetical protein
MRFTLSYRDVEDLLAERGLDVSYETVRRWVLKFGPLFARELRRRRTRPTSRWHLDEMAVTIAGRQFWVWRAVDDEGEVLDLLVQRRRDKAAAVKLMCKLLKKQGFASDVLVTDKRALTARQSPKSDCRLATTRAYARTIRLRIHISLFADASARCNVSSRPDQLNASFPFTPPSKTLSTSSAISHPAARSGSSVKKLSGRGEPRQPHELELGRADFPRPIQVHVTEPWLALLASLKVPAAHHLSEAVSLAFSKADRLLFAFQDSAVSALCSCRPGTATKMRPAKLRWPFQLVPVIAESAIALGRLPGTAIENADLPL